mmetsp:Transcript_24316/g.54367  ORF Transcript_24316/g.54367 Transcript_24316/m.54367 type:complete len:231 (-) Transcript_24316:2094-2786(-)
MYLCNWEHTNLDTSRSFQLATGTLIPRSLYRHLSPRCRSETSHTQNGISLPLSEQNKRYDSPRSVPAGLQRLEEVPDRLVPPAAFGAAERLGEDDRVAVPAGDEGPGERGQVRARGPPRAGDLGPRRVRVDTPRAEPAGLGGRLGRALPRRTVATLLLGRVLGGGVFVCGGFLGGSIFRGGLFGCIFLLGGRLGRALLLGQVLGGRFFICSGFVGGGYLGGSIFRGGLFG